MPGSPSHPTADRAVRRRLRAGASTSGHLATMGRVRDDLLVRVTAEPIGAEEAVAFVSDPGAGGTCVFLGTVRDSSADGEVTGLTYEAWDELATRRLGELGTEMLERWPLR